MISVIQRMIDGMVSKDLELLRGVMSEDMVLVHMTGMEQNREQFLSQLEDGTLNYRSYRIIDVKSSKYADNAQAEVRMLTDAAVYGSGYRIWRLSMSASLVKCDGKWKITRSEVSTF